MVRLLPEDVVELRMQRPATWVYHQQAGQYAYVMVPEVNTMPSCATPLSKVALMTDFRHMIACATQEPHMPEHWQIFTIKAGEASFEGTTACNACLHGAYEAACAPSPEFSISPSLSTQRAGCQHAVLLAD